MEMHVYEGGDKNEGDGVRGTSCRACYVPGTVLSVFTVYLSKPSRQPFEIGVTISSIFLPRKPGLS